MSRRTLSVGVAVVITIVLAVLAASAGEVRLWDAPSSTRDRTDSGAPVEQVDDPVAPPTSEPDREPRDLSARWIVQVVAVLVGAFIAVAAVLGFSQWRPGLVGRRAPNGGEMPDPVDDLVEPAMSVDGAAARAALREGSPRNAIVACWMQLERDAADAGLRRRAAETSSEYVERVVAASSVDHAPIQELATLFREARFSDHEMGETHRARALDLLDAVEAALRGGNSVRA